MWTKHNSNKSDNNIIHPTNEPNLTQCNVTEPKQNICSPYTLTISVKQEEELSKCTLYLCALSYAFMLMHINTLSYSLWHSITKDLNYTFSSSTVILCSHLVDNKNRQRKKLKKNKNEHEREVRSNNYYYLCISNSNNQHATPCCINNNQWHIYFNQTLVPSLSLSPSQHVYSLHRQPFVVREKKQCHTQ